MIQDIYCSSLLSVPGRAGAFSRDFTTILVPECRAFSGALKIEKLKAPLIPGPKGAVDTNDWCITAKLISAFVSATRIVKSLYFLNPKFQASSHLLWLHRPVCVGPGQKPRRPVFSQGGSFDVTFSCHSISLVYKVVHVSNESVLILI